MAASVFGRQLSVPPKARDQSVGAAPPAYDVLQVRVAQAHLVSAEGLERVDAAAIAASQLRDLAFLP